MAKGQMKQPKEKKKPKQEDKPKQMSSYKLAMQSSSPSSNIPAKKN